MVELILRKYYSHSYTHACGSHIPSVRENLIHDCNSTSRVFDCESFLSYVWYMHKIAKPTQED